MKVIVVGCTHAGTAAVVNIAKQYPDASITVYERNDNISFLSCGIALYVGGVVEDPQGLFYATPEQLKELGVKMHMRHDVVKIDSENKTVLVKNIATNEQIEDSYDKLIMATGSWPIIPKIEGIDLENILLCKNYEHSNTIIEKAKDARKIVVIGAGYIGIELVEAFEMNGKEVTLIDGEQRILSKYLDQDFTHKAEVEFLNRGVTLALGQTVTTFKGESGKVTKVVTTAGEYEAHLVILCIGFCPQTELLKGQVDMLPNGAIKVNPYMETSKKDIYAAGDSCAVKYNPIKDYTYIPLATNAVRMGTLVAYNLVEPKISYMGTQGTSGIKIYDYNIASTGLTEAAAKQANMDVKTITVQENYRPEFMPTVEEVILKVVYETESRRIVGAQILSKADLTQSVNTLSVCIQTNMKIEELGFVDFFFQPHYNKPWNFLNQAGLQSIK